MKILSFHFVVIFYFVSVQINCDINSSYSDVRTQNINSAGFSKLLLGMRNFSQILNNDTTMNMISFEVQKSVLTNEDRGQMCLNDLNRCMESDLEYEATANHISKVIFSTAPPLDLSQIKGASLMCRKQSQQYIHDLAKFKLWALKMYDSNAKLPSGILNGNVNQFGDFDQCLQATNLIENIHSQYCLAAMQIETPSSPYLSALHKLFQSHSHFQSQLDDPGHRVPRFSSINWAFCLPSSCTSHDLQLGINELVGRLTEDTDLKVRTKIDPGMCTSSKSESIPTSTIVVTGIFIMVIVLVLIATFYDFHTIKNHNEWIMAFSLRKNVKHLISLNRSPGDIEAIHGVRFLNAILLMLAHKSMAVFFTPYTNRTEMVEFIGQPWTVLARAASLYTDPFIMISGTLTAYSLLQKLEKTKRVNLGKEYVSRLLRILPALITLMSFCTFILPWLNMGPLWNLVVSQHSDICKRNWWRNILFIHNYFGFEDMCLTHTHHVGIDTQLFFVSPILIWTVWRWPRKGLTALVALASISTVWRFYVTYSMRLSNYIHFGTSIQQLFATADNMYIIPVHRATVYIIGILLGYILRNCKNIHLSKRDLHLGNTFAIFSFLVSFVGPSFMGSISYKYNPTDAALYAAFAPIFWCFTFAWIIFTTHIGYRGIAEKFFSWNIFNLWTKISYTVYLIQFPVYFYNVGTARTAEHFGFFRMMINIKEYGWIISLAIILTLLVEIPFQNIRNIIFTHKKHSICANNGVAKAKKIM